MIRTEQTYSSTNCSPASAVSAAGAGDASGAERIGSAEAKTH